MFIERKNCSKLFIITIFFSFSSYLYSAPYHGEIFEFEQPDGSKVKVKLYGDEYYIRAESLDGYTLIRDTQTGWICYADLSEDKTELLSTGIVYKDDVLFEEVYREHLKTEKDQKKLSRLKNLKPKLDLKKEAIEEIRKRNKRRLYHLEKTFGPPLPLPDDESLQQDIPYPAPPTRKALGTIKGLVIIVDFPDAPATLPIDEYNRWFNDMNYNNFNNNGSVRKYFYDISEGKLDYQGVVFGIFRAPNTFSYYDSLPYGQGAREILAWVLPLIDQQGFDFSTLTTDSNRRILAINLVYTGSPRTWAEGMWYHQGSYTGFTADGVRSYLYACASANSPLRIGTMCHENGHMICGWPDTYKYDSTTGPDGIGAFDLMCSGSSPGNNPTPPNPYFLYTVGWASLIDINDWGARIIFDTANDLIFYRYRNPNNSKEFYILNTVRKTGRYTNVPDEGLCIWRIDEDGDNQTTRHMVYLVHANNDITDHTRACFRADRNYDKFNAYTTPAATWYGNILSFFNCCNISNVSSTMTYRVYDLNREWYFLSNHEGWSLSNSVTGSVSGGVLSLNVAGNDPYILSPDNLSISASTYKYIKIRLKNNSNDIEAKFYWITTSDTQWNEAKSKSFFVSRNDSDFKEYLVDFSESSSWSGTIKRIRFDPPGSSGSVEIDYIKLEKDPGIISGKIYAIKSKHSGKFISVQDNSDVAGTNIVQLDYQGLLGQCWRVEDVGDNYYRFTSIRSNLVFDIKNTDIANGVELIQRSWGNLDGQKFKVDGLTAGDYRLTARHSGKSLEVEGLSLENNAKIIQWDWHGGNNQRWNFVLTHSIETSINPPQGGSISRSLNYERYLNGTQLTFTAIPSKGYRFVSWSGSYNSPSPNLQFNITGDIQLTANFTLTTHTVLVSVVPSNSAIVEIQPKQDYYTYGTTITLTIIPNEGYEFIKWSGDLDISSNPLKLIVENDINLTANLRLTTHTFTVKVEPPQAAQLEVHPLKDYYTYFDTVTVVLTINEGYEFLGWSGSYSGFDNPLLLEIKGDISLYATFRLTTHTIVIEILPENAGTVSKQPDSEFYDYGSTLTLTASTFEGWWFDRWEGDINTTENPLQIIVKNDLNIKAIYTPSLHTVSVIVNPIDAGSYTISPQQQYYTYGSTVVLKVNPNVGWEFISWSGDVNNTNEVISIEIKKNIVLYANFKLSTYTIITEIIPSWAGEIKLTPYLDYYTYGTTVTIQAIPKNKKYKFVGWEGDLVGETPIVVFIVDSHKHITAKFIQISDYLLTLNNDGINEDIYFGEDVKEINIYSSKGKLIKNIKSNKLNNATIEGWLSTGFYLIEIKLYNGKNRFEKLVVVK